MSGNIANLSDALNEAAPGRKLVAAIKSDSDRINRELSTENVSFIVVDGKKYKITGSGSEISLKKK